MIPYQVFFQSSFNGNIIDCMQRFDVLVYPGNQNITSMAVVKIYLFDNKFILKKWHISGKYEQSFFCRSVYCCMNPSDWSDFQKLIYDDFVFIVFFKFFRSVGYNNYLIENIPYCVCNSGNNCFSFPSITMFDFVMPLNRLLAPPARIIPEILCTIKTDL